MVLLGGLVIGTASEARAAGTAITDISVVDDTGTNVSWCARYTWNRTDGANGNGNVGGSLTGVSHITDQDGSGLAVTWHVYLRDCATQVLGAEAQGSPFVSGPNTANGTTVNYTTTVHLHSLPPTNCVDHVSIRNPMTTVSSYQLYRNGLAFGVVQVASGVTAVMDMPNPTCAALAWTYAQIGGPSLVDPQSPDSLNGPGFTWDPNGGYDSPLTGPPVVAPTIRNGGAGGGNPAPAPPGQQINPPTPAPYTNDPTIVSNQPIVYPTNSFYNPASPANNGTIQQGFAGVVTEAQQGHDAIVKAIQELDRNNKRGHAGTSNLLANLGTGSTNVLDISGITNRMDAASNSMSTNVSQILSNFSNFRDTNFLLGQGTSLGAADLLTGTGLTNAFTGVATFTPPAYNASFWTVSAGGRTFDVDPMGANGHGMSTVAAVCSNIVKWSASLGFMTWLAMYCMGYVKSLPQARQVGLPNVQLSFLGFGGNLGALTYPVYIAVLVLIMGVLPITVLAFITSKHSTLLSNLLGSPLEGLTGPMAAAVSLFAQFVPMAFLMGLGVGVVVDMLAIGIVYTGICWAIRALPAN